MGHIPDNQDNDDFMNASAEEWSKPETPAPMPEREPDETDRWGATMPEGSLLHFMGKTWQRDEGLRLTEHIGAWSCIAGSAGWLLINIVLYREKRKSDPPEEDE